jgi:hypothetical protein
MRFSIFIVIAFIFAGCTKDNAGSESVLYGTWGKGPAFGDTLQFMRKNNHDIVRYSMSFNAGMPVYTEHDYTYRNGILSIKLYSPSIQDFYPISSFEWTQQGREFKIQGIQLFSFMASTQTYFTYRKI